MPSPTPAWRWCTAEPSARRPLPRRPRSVERDALPRGDSFSAPAAESRYADCARALGAATDGDSDALAADRLVKALRALCKDLGVPTPRAHGIDKDEWFRLPPLMAEQALVSGSPANNPVVPTVDEIQDRYAQINAWHPASEEP
ncbi:iron-containing alcohol dehydrogenase [Streptomyces sp. NPDC060006]|uniref:iron-containing alcohol dehydrogenase n=1 Tax=unclassified Streptomyces TaxID=2593676 RepID=UPI0036C5C6AC